MVVVGVVWTGGLETLKRRGLLGSGRAKRQPPATGTRNVTQSALRTDTARRRRWCGALACRWVLWLQRRAPPASLSVTSAHAVGHLSCMNMTVYGGQ